MFPFFFAVVQTTVGAALSYYWAWFSEGMYRQETLNRAARLYREEVENLNASPEIPLKRKQGMYRRMWRLWSVAKGHHEGSVGHRPKATAGRYVLNPHSKRLERTADEPMRRIWMMVVVQASISGLWWMTGCQASVGVHVSACMVMIVSACHGWLYGRQFRAKRRDRGLEAALTLTEHQTLVDFEVATKSFDNGRGVLVFSIENRQDGNVETKTVRMPKLTRETWKSQADGKDGLDFAERLMPVLKRMRRWENETLFRGGGKEGKEPPYQTMFRMLCAQQFRDFYIRDFAKQLWAESPDKMLEAIELLHQLRTVLDEWATTKEVSETSKETTPSEQSPRSFEEERLLRMMDLVQDVRDKEEVDEEVKEMAARTWSEMQERLSEVRQAIQEGHREWQEMKDYSTLSSIRTEMEMEMTPSETRAWEKERRFSSTTETEASEEREG